MFCGEDTLDSAPLLCGRLALTPLLLSPTCAVFAQDGGDQEEERAQFAQEPVEAAEADEGDAAEEVVNEAAADADADAAADEATTIRVHPLTDIPAPAAGIVSAIIFPDNAEKGACVWSAHCRERWEGGMLGRHPLALSRPRLLALTWAVLGAAE